MDFKFKVVSLGEKLDEGHNFNLGEIYESKNGIVRGNFGYDFTAWSIHGDTFDNLQEFFRKWYLFELVTDPDPIANPVNDPVNHPSHYTKGKIEVADFIADQKLNFDRGNAVKYVCRAGSKDPDKEIQDLEKAIWYINHEIKTLKGETENEI